MTIAWTFGVFFRSFLLSKIVINIYVIVDMCSKIQVSKNECQTFVRLVVRPCLIQNMSFLPKSQRDDCQIPGKSRQFFFLKQDL